jgi:quercetin dioxygenase-like cupin family protein
MTAEPTPSPGPIPADDLSRRLAVARPDQNEHLPHIGLVGDTYTILIGGRDTNGIYTLIDMHVPPGGGPPPHRHDFEEMFTVLEGEVAVTFRGDTITLHEGETVNVPANSPHGFRNVGEAPSRPAVYVRARRTGRVLHPYRSASCDSDRTAPAARCAGSGGVHRQGSVARTAVPHGAPATARRRRITDLTLGRTSNACLVFAEVGGQNSPAMSRSGRARDRLGCSLRAAPDSPQPQAVGAGVRLGTAQLRSCRPWRWTLAGRPPHRRRDCVRSRARSQLPQL